MDNGSMPQPGLAMWPRASHCSPTGAEGRPGQGAGDWGAGCTHHCRILESMGLEKIGGEVLATVGLGSNPSISKKKYALGGHPSKAVRAGARPIHLCVQQPCCQGCPPTSSMLYSMPTCPCLTFTAALWGGRHPYHPHCTGVLRSSNLPEVTQQVGG